MSPGESKLKKLSGRSMLRSRDFVQINAIRAIRG
jgi:hypothetical protein